MRDLERLKRFKVSVFAGSGLVLLSGFSREHNKQNEGIFITHKARSRSKCSCAHVWHMKEISLAEVHGRPAEGPGARRCSVHHTGFSAGVGQTWTPAGVCSDAKDRVACE